LCLHRAQASLLGTCRTGVVPEAVSAIVFPIVVEDRGDDIRHLRAPPKPASSFPRENPRLECCWMFAVARL